MVASGAQKLLAAIPLEISLIAFNRLLSVSDEMEDSSCRRSAFRQSPKNLVKPSLSLTAGRYYAHDDIGYLWAREAIRYGNAAILAQYLWQADEVDPRVRRELAELVSDLKPLFAIRRSISLSR